MRQGERVRESEGEIIYSVSEARRGSCSDATPVMEQEFEEIDKNGNWPTLYQVRADGA